MFRHIKKQKIGNYFHTCYCSYNFAYDIDNGIETSVQYFVQKLVAVTEFFALIGRVVKK